MLKRIWLILCKLYLKIITPKISRDYYMKVFCRIYKDTLSIDPEGLPRFISLDVKLDNSARIHVGKGTTIASMTAILTHDFSIDYGLIALGRDTRTHEYQYRREVIIGENTFIGQRCTILPGVTIGNNCIIGACSLVNKDIPDNSVAAGIPAKVLASTDHWIHRRLERDKDFIV